MDGLESEHEITFCASVGIVLRGSISMTTTLNSFCKAVLISSYVDKLIKTSKVVFLMKVRSHHCNVSQTLLIHLKQMTLHLFMVDE